MSLQPCERGACGPGRIRQARSRLSAPSAPRAASSSQKAACQWATNDGATPKACLQVRSWKRWSDPEYHQKCDLRLAVHCCAVLCSPHLVNPNFP